MTPQPRTDDHPRPTLTIVPGLSQPIVGCAQINDRQQEILDVIAAAPDPISTGDVRKQVNATRAKDLVLEQVYRALRALHDRRLIERVEVEGASQVHWQLTDSQRRRHRHRLLQNGSPR
ncbi:transcriptional repressor [Mycolicibacterium houstonense]|uniref:transcriptional repressor n=1 Tax=Mycolicibacterium houstonense TaxID=146021 RepID=UPI003F993125